MGYRHWCSCPDILEQYTNQWFYIYTVNDTVAFYETQWQLVDVGCNYIVVRRPVVDLGGFQTTILFCDRIVALAEAPPDPGPVV